MRSRRVWRCTPGYCSESVTATLGGPTQREQMHQYVREERGRLHTRTDRATDAVRDVLHRHAPESRATRSTLLAVHFKEAHRRRHNPFLSHAVEGLGWLLVNLLPKPLIIDAQDFDPARHSSPWRKQDENAKAQQLLAAKKGIRNALAEIPLSYGRLIAVTDVLNARQVQSIRGGAWTPEKVRKLTRRIATSSMI